MRDDAKKRARKPGTSKISAVGVKNCEWGFLGWQRQNSSFGQGMNGMFLPKAADTPRILEFKSKSTLSTLSSGRKHSYHQQNRFILKSIKTLYRRLQGRLILRSITSVYSKIDQIDLS